MEPLDRYAAEWRELERELMARTPSSSSWERALALGERLLSVGRHEALVRAAARCESHGRGEIAELWRGLIDRDAADYERALTRFAGLAARRLATPLPALLELASRIELGQSEYPQSPQQLAKQALADKSGQWTPQSLARLANLALRVGQRDLSLRLEGRRRQLLGGARAAGSLAEELFENARTQLAVREAVRALCAWPPPAPALRVVARCCRERGYHQQAALIEAAAVRLDPARPRPFDIDVARVAAEQRARPREVIGSAVSRSDQRVAVELEELPGLIQSVTYFVEDDPQLLGVMLHMWRCALRRVPTAVDIALRAARALKERGCPRRAKALLRRTYALEGLEDEQRGQIHARLQAMQASAVESALEAADTEAETEVAAGEDAASATIELPEELRDSGRLLTDPQAHLVRVDGSIDGVERVLQYLAEPARRSVLLIGESGVGKTALVHEVVRRIRAANCPESLRGFAVLELTVQDLLVGTEYVGSLQTKMGKILRAATVSKRILVTIPDVAFVVGAGSYDKSDYDLAASIFTAISRGDLLVIGEARKEEVRVARTRRPDFLRWFETYEVREPSPEVTRSIVAAAAEHFELQTGVAVEVEALDRLVELQARFAPARRFPGKALDFLEQIVREAALDAQLQQRDPQPVESDRVVEEFAKRTGLPRAIFVDAEALDLAATEKFFVERVLGQPEAVHAVIDQVAMIKAGLARPGRPLASSFFVGPTGIGKTELARALAAFLFGSEERLVRLDMSEFASADALWRLTGQPGSRHDPGTRGLLTDPVREQPFCVVLLDEIEKAAPQVFDLLLQVLDAGRLTDARGTTTSFCNAIVIMTSNLGSERAQAEGVGFGSGPRGAAEIAKAMEQHFRPEFINRIGRVVTFRPLVREDLRKLAYREIGKVFEREGVLRRRLAVEIDPALADDVLEHGFSARYGARHLQRAVEQRVAIPLARAFVNQRQLRDASLRVSVGSEGARIEVVPMAPEIEEVPIEKAPQVRGAKQHFDRGRVLAAIEDAQARLAQIAAVLLASGVEQRRSELEAIMATPSFWDRPQIAAEVQHEYARLVRRVDRIERLRQAFKELEAEAPRALERATGPARMAAQLQSLQGECDRLEIESLLQAPDDVADAYVLVASAGRRREADEWVRTLVELYRRFAAQSRWEFFVLGEVAPSGTAGGGILCLVRGAYAYGQLHLEAGLHRRSDGPIEKRGAKDARVALTARVGVWPEFRGAELPALEWHSERRSSEAGLILPRLARRIVLSQVHGSRRAEILAPRSDAHDDDLRGWFASMLTSAAVPADVVRHYRGGAESRVRDPLTGLDGASLRDPLTGQERASLRQVLGGAIAEFLLARLRHVRGTVRPAAAKD